jgi:DNA repair protein RadD
MTTTFLSTEEAAEFLGIGKTKLYALTKEGRIPANRLGKKWTYERDALAQWLRGNRSLESYFIDTPATVQENSNLREPQRDAYMRALDFFENGGTKAILQLPVGCGKSGLASILPFGIAPNLTIKDELLKSLDITNKQKCFWRRMRVLDDKDMVSGPYVTTLDIGNIAVCEQSHIVLTNIQQLATNVDKWLTKFSDSFFDLIIVDEAHHGAAPSWKKVFDKFPKAKVVNLTAFSVTHSRAPASRATSRN